jgi:hypothetical protein
MENSNKETAILEEQQLSLTYISQNLSAINMNLKSIAESLSKIADKGVDIFSRCATTNN